MAELTINADDVRNALNEFAASYEPGNAERVEVGRVVSASDGIARVEGLPSVMANELLRFEDGTLGLAQNLDTRNIGVIVLGDFTGIEEGQVCLLYTSTLMTEGDSGAVLVNRLYERKPWWLIAQALIDSLSLIHI